MKLRILMLFFFFTFSTSSTFAVIDVNEQEPTQRIQNFPKENFSKKKNIKKRKFRLRDFFKLKKKIKKARKVDKKEISTHAIISLVLALSGIGIGIMALRHATLFLAYLFFGAELGAIILGVLGLYKIMRNPENLKGKGLAWAGIIIPLLVGLLLLALLIIITITY